MKLSFFGAAHAVTGSCHCLEVGGKKILIDCGLQQGRDEHDDNALDFSPSYIDYVIVTHAHIDHSGRIPLLVKEGFQGQIFTTRLTGELLSIMLRDSAFIQESDAQWQNQKGKRAGRPEVEPLYTVADAEAALEQIFTVEYGQTLDLCEGVKIRFRDAGHLLGSSIVEIWAKEGDVERKLVFSGDLGNVDQPIIRDPEFLEEADYVVMESTYGDRDHEVPESYTEALAQLIDDTFAQGGNVVIPSFAVGRTQELLYFLREIKNEGLVKTHPDFQVCVDSPLAAEATKIYAGDLRGYLDEEAIAVLQGGENLFTFHTIDTSYVFDEFNDPQVLRRLSHAQDVTELLATFLMYASQYFQRAITQLDAERNDLDAKLSDDIDNKDLVELSNIEKSLVYLSSSIQTDQMMLHSLQHSLPRRPRKD